MLYLDLMCVVSSDVRSSDILHFLYEVRSALSTEVPIQDTGNSRDAHRIFFMIPSKIKIKILAKRAIYGTLGINGLTKDI